MHFFSWKTRAGEFLIVPRSGGGWDLVFEGQGLGCYHRPEQAAEDVASGACYWPGALNPGKLGISGDLSDWTVHTR